jgi:hypothetical protein
MESPFVASRLYAPAGLIPTAEERAVLAGIGAGAGSAVETDRFTRESPDIEPTSPRGGP